MLTFSEMTGKHKIALADTGTLVSEAARRGLAGPTPCQDWDLADLVGHMIGQNIGFAAAVETGDAEEAEYASRPVLAHTAVALWQDSATRLHTAFTAADPDRSVHLSEFDVDVTVAFALGMQLLDTAVHAWDVATALATNYRPDDTVVDFVLDFARRIAARSGHSPSFAQPVPEIGDDPWTDALRLLGRPPT